MMNDRPKVMVLDDDEGVRVTLEGIIEDEGYDVVGAPDGYQAIELAKETPFALNFMDVKMPGINGVETYREIKKISPGSVVVIMTGFSIEELVKTALKEGAYAVIYKPVAMEQIIEIMRAVLRTTFVLVVDDRAADRDTPHAIFEDIGYKVYEAWDGRQAISTAIERHYDVIVMDIRMPGMDGFTTFEEIRMIDPLVKVIFITGYDLESPARDALLNGAYTVLTKPVDPEEMLALMSSITARTDGDE